MYILKRISGGYKFLFVKINKLGNFRVIIIISNDPAGFSECILK
jgi:hypothetical protein